MANTDRSPETETAVELQFLRSRRNVPLFGRAEFRVGSSEACDVVLDDASLPGLFGIIRIQQGCVWLESANADQEFFVEGRGYHRLALRSGDRVEIGSCGFEVQVLHDPLNELMSLMNSMHSTGDMTTEFAELSASDLCDRLEAELAMIDELESSLEADVNAVAPRTSSRAA